MATLDLLGALSRATTFDIEHYSIERLARVYSDGAQARSYMDDIRAQALRHGRNDIADSVERSLSMSAWRHRWMRASEQVSRAPLLWRISAPIERFALRNTIYT